MSIELMDLKSELKLDDQIKIDTFRCDKCIPRTITKDVFMNLKHENATYEDFGPGIVGWFGDGACDLDEACVSRDTRVFNKGCSACYAVIHEGECMNIHKNQKLNLETIRWVRSNIELVVKHYMRLRKLGILTEDQYWEYVGKLQNYVL
jgi:hypothetical protein